MPINAGERITSANTSWDMGGTPLTDKTSGVVANTYQAWGTETIQFDDPGTAVKISAQLSGRAFNTVDGEANGMGRIGISIDGGTTFTYGNEPFVGCGTNSTSRGGFSASHFVAGTPTGDIVIKAECRGSSNNNQYQSGYLTAELIPQ